MAIKTLAVIDIIGSYGMYLDVVSLMFPYHVKLQANAIMSFTPTAESLLMLIY